MRRIFITGTGTGIGKSFITATLTRQLRTAGHRTFAIKPILSGMNEGWEHSDSAVLLAANGIAPTQENQHLITHTALQAPQSPDIAARMEQTELNYPELLAFCRQPRDADLLLIEGAGGVMVPLDATHTMRNLMQGCDAEILLVTRNYLGALSHTLTALDSLAAAQLIPRTIIINHVPNGDVPAAEMEKSLRNFTSVPIHQLPFQPAGGITENITHWVL